MPKIISLLHSQTGSHAAAKRSLQANCLISRQRLALIDEIGKIGQLARTVTAKRPVISPVNGWE